MACVCNQILTPCHKDNPIERDRCSSHFFDIIFSSRAAGLIQLLVYLLGFAVYLSALCLCIQHHLTYQSVLSQLIILPCGVQTLWDFVFRDREILENPLQQPNVVGEMQHREAYECKVSVGRTAWRLCLIIYFVFT